MVFRNNLVLLIGPTGAGKSTLAKAIKETWPIVGVLKSFRTRSKRPHETDSGPAAFISHAEFRRHESRGLLQHVECHGGDLYGLERGSPTLLDQQYLSTMSPGGAIELKAALGATVILCSARPDVLRDRINKRIADGDESAGLRLQDLERELERFVNVPIDYLIDTEQSIAICIQALSPVFDRVSPRANSRRAAFL